MPASSFSRRVLEDLLAETSKNDKNDGQYLYGNRVYACRLCDATFTQKVTTLSTPERPIELYFVGGFKIKYI